MTHEDRNVQHLNNFPVDFACAANWYEKDASNNNNNNKRKKKHWISSNKNANNIIWFPLDRWDIRILQTV